LVGKQLYKELNEPPSAIEVIEGIIPPTSGEIIFKGRPKTASFRNERATLFSCNE